MTQVFGAAYADVYDTFYRDKDYTAECAAIESLLEAAGRQLTILDLGCGTGGHAKRLADRGHFVTGVDCSPDMIDVAQRTSKGKAEFLVGDLRTIRLEKSFDAVIMMFAVLGYQTSDEDVVNALRTVRTHLRPGGLFLCDFWYGPAVLAQKPGMRTRVIDTPSGPLLRTASSQWHASRETCTVTIEWKRAGEASHSEQHAMRYFFPETLDHWLKATNLERIRLSAWPETDKPADENTWNACLLARVK